MKKTSVRASPALAVIGTLLGAVPLSAQSLSQQNDQILQELKAIRQLLEKLAAVSTASASSARSRMRCSTRSSRSCSRSPRRRSVTLG